MVHGMSRLVGENTGTIPACYATGAVSGGDYVGGLVGCNEGGTIMASYSIGSVRVLIKSEVIGENGGKITACYATGTVSGVTMWRSGGIWCSRYEYGLFLDMQTTAGWQFWRERMMTSQMRTLSIYQNASWQTRDG